MSANTDGYNKCFNELHLKETNKLRATHQADALLIDEPLAKKL